MARNKYIVIHDDVHHKKGVVYENNNPKYWFGNCTWRQVLYTIR